MTDDKRLAADEVVVSVSAKDPDQLRRALTILRAGAGDRLGYGERLDGGMTSSTDFAAVYMGQLRVEPGPNSVAYLGAILRAILFASKAEQQVAAISARLWLSSHCAFCGALVPIEQQDVTSLVVWCNSCVLMRDSSELDRLLSSETLTYDQDTIMAFIRDQRTPGPIRDQFYLLMMEEQIAKLATDGYTESGRGAVLLDQSKARPFAAYYLDAATVAGGLGWPNDETERWVSEYNPETEVVVIFVKPGPQPPEVYRIERRTASQSVDLTWPRPMTTITPSA